MSLKLGSTSIGSLYLGSTKIGAAYLGSTKVYSSAPSLPAFTLRLKFPDGETPTFSKGTAVQVSTSPNILDLTYANPDWSSLCMFKSSLLEVIAANTTGVTDMSQMFYYCSNLTSAPRFDTSSVTNMRRMFHRCGSLQSVPLFDTSNVTNMDDAFGSCYKVQSGALALYQQASTQTTPPASHSDTFAFCGSDTTTGAAELAQISTDWGGNAT